MARANGKKGQGKVISKMGLQDAIEMGVGAIEKGDRKEAYSIFKQTDELNPDTSEVWVWLGGTSPDLETAESAFEHAYTIAPDNEAASLGLRWVRLQRKVSLADIVGASASTTTAPIVPEQPSYASSAVATAAASTSQGTIVCPNCGVANEADDNFCVQCGQDLS